MKQYHKNFVVSVGRNEIGRVKSHHYFIYWKWIINALNWGSLSTCFKWKQPKKVYVRRMQWHCIKMFTLFALKLFDDLAGIVAFSYGNIIWFFLVLYDFDFDLMNWSDLICWMVLIIIKDIRMQNATADKFFREL